MNAIKAWLPRPRSANSPPLDAAVALALAILAAVYLRSRSNGGDVVGQAAGILGAALLGIYSATVPAASRSSLRGMLMAVAGVVLSLLAGPRPAIADLGPLSLPVAVFLLTRVQASRQLGADLVKRRAADLERDQEERAQAAVAEERARIARELHDVVAHSVGVMVVQAQGAERVMDANPEATREALRVISSTGREAVAEMHRLVGILRDSPGGDSLAPQPGLAQLDTLLDQTRAAGLPVVLTVDGTQRPLAGGIDLAAYRIVQEALTNTRKHAGVARATVRIHHGRTALEVEVADDGTGVSSRADGSGHGLVGMKERVALYGGTFKAGPRPGGGFAVFASLPRDTNGR